MVQHGIWCCWELLLSGVLVGRMVFQGCCLKVFRSGISSLGQSGISCRLGCNSYLV
jgi:hypothetical protein